MEESKAAAYYDELTRKGGGAAKFKQGLGFTTQSSDTDAPVKGSALPSSTSSFLSNFVKSSTTTTESEIQHQSELHNIKNKLKKKPPSLNSDHPRVSDRDGDYHSRRRSRSRSEDRSSRDQHRSSSRDRERSRSGVSEDEQRRRRRRERSRSLSPTRNEVSDRSGKDRHKYKTGRNDKVDYSRLIEGYSKMTPAERVKAKMKLQLTETVNKDATKGMGSGWERFEFNKDAPLDDEEMEAVEDDAKLVHHIGQSFRFSAVEARKEEEIKSAHDKAMFGVPSTSTSITTNHKVEEEIAKTDTDLTSLMSEKVLANQKGSWRDRVRKV